MGCVTVFMSVFFLIGFGVLGYGIWSARRSTQAAAWPTVPGTITQLSVQENSDSDGNTYEVKVRYMYKVDGVVYQGSRLAFGYAGSSGREAHDEIHRKLQGANTITVRYNPSDPSVSCLSFGLHRSIQVILVFAVTWLVFVLGLALFVWILSRSDRVLLDNLSMQ